jgi:hypothetical protein
MLNAFRDAEFIDEVITRAEIGVVRKEKFVEVLWK